MADKVKHKFRFTPIDVILIIAIIMIGASIAISNYQFEVTRDLSEHFTRIAEHATRQNTDIARQIDDHEARQQNRSQSNIDAVLNSAEINYNATLAAATEARLKIDEQTNQTFRYLNAELSDLNEDINLIVAALNLTSLDRIVNNGTHIFIKNDTQGAIPNPIPLGEFGKYSNYTILDSRHKPLENQTTTPNELR
jgi:Tfp pilus assembly protein PilE